MEYDYEINLKLLDKIKIGCDITLTVCRLGGKNIDFGCEAPREISILREELIEKVVYEEVTLKR